MQRRVLSPILVKKMNQYHWAHTEKERPVLPVSKRFTTSKIDSEEGMKGNEDNNDILMTLNKEIYLFHWLLNFDVHLPLI